MGRIVEPSNNAFSSLEDVIDDIYTRFLFSLPMEELNSFERLGFQIEQAYWFYEDFFREPNSQFLKMLTLPQFGAEIFKRYPKLLEPYGSNITKLFNDFFLYKASIPVYGAILVNQQKTKVLYIIFSV